jgi:hypothetical protein
VDLTLGEVDDAIDRAARAATRARVLGWDLAIPVRAWGRAYIVLVGPGPHYPIVAVYRIRPDLRLKRIVQWPPALRWLALDRVDRPVRPVPDHGRVAGETMTGARCRRT